MTHEIHDEAFLTRLRHSVMTNEGTHWLADRRWALRYYQKHLRLAELHRKAAEAMPGVMIPMGAGPLHAPVTVVSKEPLAPEQGRLVASLLAEIGISDAYYTSLNRASSGDPQTLLSLLRGEVEVIGSPGVLSFGISLNCMGLKAVVLDLPELTNCVDDSGTCIESVKSALKDWSLTYTPT